MAAKLDVDHVNTSPVTDGNMFWSVQLLFVCQQGFLQASIFAGGFKTFGLVTLAMIQRCRNSQVGSMVILKLNMPHQCDI